MISKENLDKRICDVEKNADNTQTYREFIRESERMFELSPAPLDLYNDEELEEYLEELNYLWEK
ncbi:MAG: hypothetical protein E7216_11250 [Clostridium thermopalmarium]|uniref:hypothetical protein n=1 Tax=Clostridium thermopalmarium TaxID=29373 RepID=UPI00235361D4|nr:hypothetical protein [Clostridium thermopalmarium]MBE6044790.1 hypothetical protein [Clostridium thermopalmarium]